jgi:hypothetical protein
MRRQLPARTLRGSDALTLDIQMGDLVGKPLGQVALANVADLFALDEIEELPPRLRGKLRGYRDRMRRAIQDLPNGQSFQEFAEELSEVDAGRVPASLREAIAEEAERPSRTAAELKAVGDLVAGWSDNEPTPFDLSDQLAEVKRAPEARRREEARMRAPSGARTGGSVTRTPTATTRGSGSSSSSGAAKRTPKPKPQIDPAKVSWVEQVVLERLAGRSQGLLETVLIAGLKHRARERFPDLTQQEITKILKGMSEKGTVRFSARRWSVAGRNW